MKENKITMNELARQISLWRKKKGFHTPDKLDKDMLGKLMLVVTEISEAAEAVRNQDTDHFIEEIADSLIRLLDIAGTMEFDIEGAIARKMQINAERPYRHQKKIEL